MLGIEFMTKEHTPDMCRLMCAAVEEEFFIGHCRDRRFRGLMEGLSVLRYNYRVDIRVRECGNSNENRNIILLVSRLSFSLSGSSK